MKDDRLHHKYPREHATEISFDFKIFHWLLKYVHPYATWAILAIILLIAAKCIEAIVPVYIGYITQKMMANTATDAEQKQHLLDTVLRSCIWIIGLLLTGYLFETANVILKNWISQRIIFTLRTQVYEYAQHLPLRYYNSHSVGRMTTNTIYDIEQINQMFSESIIPLLGSFILFIGMFIGISMISWKIAIVFSCIVPIVIWLTTYFRYHERHWYEVVRSILSTMNAFIEEHLMGASTIRTFGLQKQEKKIFEEINSDHRQAHMKTIHYFSFFIAGIDFLQSLSLILVFMVLTLFAAPGEAFQVGAFFAFSLYTSMFFRPLLDIADRYNILQSAMAAADRVIRLLDQPIEPVELPPDFKVDAIHSIDFDDVWFAYEGEYWILKGFNLHIKKGETIALVGTTGAGKTTIISLLLRFYDIQKGTIKINGHDIRDLPLSDLRRLFSVVLQDPVIFSGTIRDNVGLYQPQITTQRIQEAIEYVDLHLFVERFPDGLDHRINERGLNLSAGERQLLSLARAVAHDRSMFMLDEATANIDLITEHAIQDTLKKMLSEKTSLVIAHRLSTIRHVSRIIVLHHGVVEESGTHDELIAKKGLYEKLYRVQFLTRGQV